jgi:hypothetical protein
VLTRIAFEWLKVIKWSWELGTTHKNLTNKMISFLGSGPVCLPKYRATFPACWNSFHMLEVYIYIKVNLSIQNPENKVTILFSAPQLFD